MLHDRRIGPREVQGSPRPCSRARIRAPTGRSRSARSPEAPLPEVMQFARVALAIQLAQKVRENVAAAAPFRDEV